MARQIINANAPLRKFIESVRTKNLNPSPTTLQCSGQEAERQSQCDQLPCIEHRNWSDGHVRPNRYGCTGIIVGACLRITVFIAIVGCSNGIDFGKDFIGSRQYLCKVLEAISTLHTSINSRRHGNWISTHS